MNRLYDYSPVWLQNFFTNLHGYRVNRKRYSSSFFSRFEEYLQRQHWSSEQLIEYRDAKLREMVAHCYLNVPYYTQLFDSLHLVPNEINGLEDLNKLPVIDKATVKENFEFFIAKNIPRNQLLSAKTSGSTGSGFSFFTTREALDHQWAVCWRYRMAMGIDFGTLCAVFGKQKVVPLERQRGPFYRRSSFSKQLYFSSYHITPQNIREYVSDLEREQVKWIHGYPSSISLLAAAMLEENLSLSYQVEHVTTASENLLEHQRELIKKVFGVAPHDHYAMAEGVANFSCTPSGEMIVDEDYAAVEFVGDGPSKQIIGTTLANYAMPFLRYNTHDLATLATGDSSSHQRMLSSIDGRFEDYVVLKNGKKVGRLDPIFKSLVNINEAQIYQKQAGKIVLRIVKSSEYSDRDEIFVYHSIRDWLGDQVDTEIEYVESLPKTASGKLRLVISEVE